MGGFRLRLGDGEAHGFGMVNARRDWVAEGGRLDQISSEGFVLEGGGGCDGDLSGLGVATRVLSRSIFGE